ncbi:phage major capsid protein [Micrococcaceae bacterium Sec5.8]
MTFLESAAGGILPTEYAELITKPVTAQALAFNPALATVVNTGSKELQVPILNSDAGAAWVAEGAEITPDDPSIGELTITPRKVAGLTIISSELAKDSSPAAQELVGQGLARSIINQINAAFLGDLAAPAPKGLESLQNVTELTGSLANLDVFAESIAAAEDEDAQISGFIAHPSDALLLAKLKEATGSNKTLMEDARTILGRPLIVSPKAIPGTVYGVAAPRIITVLREDVEIAVSADSHFTSDRVAIRATLRVGFGFPDEASITRITLS